MSEADRLLKNFDYELDKVIENSKKADTATAFKIIREPITLVFLSAMKKLEQKEKRIQKLQEENARLKIVRAEYEYGYENTHFITKNDLVEIDKNKYLIEIEEGNFIDIKQLYLDNLDSIPKQTIKDKIEELKNNLKYIDCNGDCSKCFNKEGKALYRGSDFNFCFAYYQIKGLQELLEGEK